MALSIDVVVVAVCSICKNDRFDIHCSGCRPHPDEIHYKPVDVTFDYVYVLKIK